MKIQHLMEGKFSMICVYGVMTLLLSGPGLCRGSVEADLKELRGFIEDNKQAIGRTNDYVDYSNYFMKWISKHKGTMEAIAANSTFMSKYTAFPSAENVTKQLDSLESQINSIKGHVQELDENLKKNTLGITKNFAQNATNYKVLEGKSKLADEELKNKIEKLELHSKKTYQDLEKLGKNVLGAVNGHTNIQNIIRSLENRVERINENQNNIKLSLRSLNLKVSHLSKRVEDNLSALKKIPTLEDYEVIKSKIKQLEKMAPSSSMRVVDAVGKSLESGSDIPPKKDGGISVPFPEGHLDFLD